MSGELPDLKVLTRLFLSGGNAGHIRSAKAFVQAAGGLKGHVVLLLQGGPDSGKYLSFYMDPWMAHGLGMVSPVLVDDDDDNSLSRLEKSLRMASAIYVGGGNTATYHKFYASGEAGKILRREIVRAGLPYGGLSAGMLVAGALRPLDPEETGEPEIQWKPGLGLFSGALCEPHYSAQNRSAALKEYLRQSGIKLGYGVDDEACLVFEPGREPRVIGKRVTVIVNK